MSPKRNPQTAAKRAREQALREKRERKAAKKQAALLARNEPETVGDDVAELDDEAGTSTEESEAGEALQPAADTSVAHDQ
jgi:hypothetical protein